jgi:hypothetical protein
MACSCYFTSSFDGLTEDTGGTTTSKSSTGTSTGGSGGSGGSAMEPAFPATALLDDFNRPDGPAGLSWKETTDGSYLIEGQALATQEPDPESIIWDQVFGPRQEIFVTLSSFVPADTELEIFLRNQGNPSECDSLVASYNTFSGPEHAVTISYCVNNQWFNLGPPIAMTLVPGDQLGMRGHEDGTVTVYRNGVEIGSRDANEWGFAKSGGRIGIFSCCLSGKVTYDDFGGGEY